MSDWLLLDRRGPVATITINRPDSRNALGEPGDGDAFAAVCAELNADRSVRAVILTGAGSAFSAGGNLKAMKERTGPFAGSSAQIRDGYRYNIHRIVKALWGLDLPLIAAVNGPAIGLGNDVACLADTRIAASTAKFGATFLKVGLVPGDGGSWLLPRVIGMARAAELFFTGDVIDAETAQAWGLISRVVAPESLMDEAHALAGRMAQQPPDVLRMTKRLLRQGTETGFEAIMEQSAACQGLAHLTEDHMEAVNAFFEKRAPDFKGR